MADLNEFYTTRAILRDSTHYTGPLSFEEWKEKPDSIKSGLLFVQFFNEITLAWMKADSLGVGDPAEGVSTVLQYLEKQVKQVQYFQKSNPTKKASADYRRSHPDDIVEVERRIIEDNPSKFSSGYIYKTAYNCLYCVAGHDRKRDKERIDNETSAIVMHDGQELNLFDTQADNRGSAEAQSDANSFEQEFWSVIENVGLPAEKVMRYLLSNDEADLRALSSRNKKYKADPLRDIEVSLDAVDGIINQLKEAFLDLPFDSPCANYIASMPSVFA